ncbi:uncharacterized protein LOC121248006 isoform X2 [Juglans microcarpa x Juglans regia]|uniref:uncharacterized protein LOC121248006 isoform X2 n=1 Tax=Juglans microcarpa x Juglans regia TaxID=2249226 RepID=UPI001B7ECF9F|nr:uncharacterized protein LOC121248006 isoform X2 [Juglans microcarpa x Juglans regia]
MADSNSFVFGTLPTSSASFSCVDVKAKLRPRKRTIVAKGGRNRCSCGANTKSSTTNSNFSNSILTTPFSNPFSSSHPPSTNFPASISFGLQSCNNKKVMPLSSDKAENSRKDAQPNQQTIQKEIETAPETSESVSSRRLPLIPISRIRKGIPHSPHFLQLRSYSEVARKSLMAGWDRAFEEIHTLIANDFWVRSSELWKTTEELQSLGYNVFRQRKSLVELTEVMEELHLYKMWIRRLKSKAESHRMEKCRLESVILGLLKSAEREQADLVEMLEEVTKMEKDAPKFNGAFAALAIEPM